ncbi:uncharacterized protein [Ambystoma mexicanum]|uniref:uncharacterized protein n=1 Tax=Ambystoma mexicanum TaxID=8296 RepID=UPI0037E88160
MSYTWGNQSSSSHSASFLVPSDNVTLTDLMDNCFMADSSINSTPFHSPYVEGSGMLKIRSSSMHVPSCNPMLMDLLENSNPMLMDMLENGYLTEKSINSTSFQSFCVENNSALKMLALSESNKLAIEEIPKGLGTSDSLASICKTPLASNLPVFDLSSLASEHNSRFNNSIVDFFCEHKISTPCKCKEKKPAPVETHTSKCLETSEVLVDLSGLQKPTPLVWELSEINLPLDNTLSLDASIEEWRLQSSVLPECDLPLSVEHSSLASALSYHWTGARPKKTSSLVFKSFAYENQASEPEPMRSLTSYHYIKPFEFAIPSPDDRWSDRRITLKSKSLKGVHT